MRNFPKIVFPGSDSRSHHLPVPLLCSRPASRIWSLRNSGCHGRASHFVREPAPMPRARAARWEPSRVRIRLLMAPRARQTLSDETKSWLSLAWKASRCALALPCRLQCRAGGARRRADILLLATSGLITYLVQLRESQRLFEWGHPGGVELLLAQPLVVDSCLICVPPGPEKLHA